MVNIVLSGPPKELGMQRGKTLKYAIQLSFEQMSKGHVCQYTWKQAREYGAKAGDDLDARCPDMYREIIGTADGAGIPVEDFLPFAFRCWNALADHPATLACYNFSCLDPAGPLLAGVLEDYPPFYLLETVRPERGIPFYAVTWAGMAWAVRCMNKAGLAIGQASAFSGTRFRKGQGRFPFELYARAYYAQRRAIQTCDNIADAIEVIRSFDCSSVFMLADKTGRVATLEACGNLHAIRNPDEQGLMTGGTFESPELVKSLLDEGIAHDWEAGVRRAQRTMASLSRAEGKTSLEWVKQYLQTEEHHGGWCHDRCQSATIACPATGDFFVSGYRPCSSGFAHYSTDDL